jgi:hypothetical protein
MFAPHPRKEYALVGPLFRHFIRDPLTGKSVGVILLKGY